MSNSSSATSKCPHVVIVGNYTQEEIVGRAQKCNVCSKPGPNLWVCMHRDCNLFIGCGELNYDHSTAHFNNNTTHCLTLNLTTFRVWCYKCQNEVYLDRNDPPLEAVSSAPLSSRIPILTNNVYVAGPCENSTSSEDELMESQEKTNLVSAEQFRSDSSGRLSTRSKGLTGLQNLGNTCYVNAALQALSNCPQLTRFMLDCSSYIRTGGLAKSYMRLIHEIWDSKRPSYVAPNGIVHGIKNVCPVFRGYAQHDAQEFLRCFLDQLHEELKECSSEQKEQHTESEMNREMSDDESNSDADYETCDSGLSSERSAFGDELCHVHDDDAERASTPSSQPSVSQGISPGGSSPVNSTRKSETAKKRSISYRSIISDIFDGRILSSVQCLTCDNISTTRETFQDISLPIPNRDHLHMLRAAASQSSKDSAGTSMGSSSQTAAYNPLSRASSTLSLTSTNLTLPTIYHWIWGWLEWVLSWLWGPTVSLQDCLSAFFSADELKGDNMYSCEKCKKLRNGIKFSKVLQLPEILCIHLKRFRHELLYSSKISSHVTFPLEGLDMAPYMAKGQGSNYSNNVTVYDLVAVICHHGTVASGHYTTYALNTINETWYEFDDQYVTAVDPQQVLSCEAYVLFYRKCSEDAFKRRQKALDLMKISRNEPSLLQFYVSKLWVNRFNTFAESGPITNDDFLCEHGGVDPEKASYVHELCTIFSRSVWEYLHALYGGGPTCTKLYICQTCTIEKENLDRRRKYEYDNFSRLNSQFTNQRTPTTVYSISMHWFKNWEAFVTKKTNDVPGPIDNTPITSVNCRSGQVTVKATSDHASLSEEMWNFLFGIYGGGPVVSHHSLRRLSSPHHHHHQHHHSTQSTASLQTGQSSHESSRIVSSNSGNQLPKVGEAMEVTALDKMEQIICQTTQETSQGTQSTCMSDAEEDTNITNAAQ
ncbi:Ubiquitin carboxyl-terminal hydrolase 20-like protein [Leptotrombidium deliense]|uniref:Ubiquitin carboxyl-terminal hydrolase n=1 Tax=Leptotrombidium deliense TaxID=299467 RepID=A0A443SL64_9ACAR|nr:Ubiquitin carboxyl-terminal hydrolase 20-like protein [Leptotrombidium deliense]